MKLSATMIGREALRLLRNEIMSPTLYDANNPPDFDMKEPRPGIYYATAALRRNSLDLSLEDFSERFIWPAMRRLAQKVSGVPLGEEYMELPRGLEDAANDHFDGIAMRTCISLKWPVLERKKGVWARIAEYYDIATDHMKTGLCSIVVVFTVHEPGMEKYRLQIPPGETNAASPNV